MNYDKLKKEEIIDLLEKEINKNKIYSKGIIEKDQTISELVAQLDEVKKNQEKMLGQVEVKTNEAISQARQQVSVIAEQYETAKEYIADILEVQETLSDLMKKEREATVKILQAYRKSII
jgi:hypothetical protein